MERICRREEHGKKGRREEHGKDTYERGTWKGYVGERNMERICKRD